MKTILGVSLGLLLIGLPSLSLAQQGNWAAQQNAEYLRGLQDGENAVKDDAVMYGAMSCLGEALLPPLGLIPWIIALTGEPGTSGYPLRTNENYMMGFRQGLEKKKSEVKSKRALYATGGCLLGSLIYAGLVYLYILALYSTE